MSVIRPDFYDFGISSSTAFALNAGAISSQQGLPVDR